ncbi:helix-turn-helix domain-containing protein [Actinocrispum sp. NPDC049592]|uniref:Crp/Fnr family transcriptional regulator n=1 Tax=Actinocrispum sp. NPDC049592 TaxID=3154835 RepID=UPI00343968CF
MSLCRNGTGSHEVVAVRLASGPTGRPGHATGRRRREPWSKRPGHREFARGAHLTEQRAARWTLTTGDRTRSDHFPLTHNFLAQMLGVRRSTVSAIAGRLQSAGLITCTRGNLTILDRQRLTSVACERYMIIKNEFDTFAAGQT